MRRIKRVMINIAAACAAAAAPFPAWCAAATCQPRDKPVYVGGVVGFESLADPAATAQLRATGRAGLYMHFSALPPALATNQLAPVYDVFRGTGNGVTELGYGFLFNPDFFGRQYQVFFNNLGQAPWAALVNAQDNYIQSKIQTLQGWKDQVATARTLGIGLFVPVAAPNDNIGVEEDPASSPVFAFLRDVSLIAGGIAVDAPPHYFLEAHPAAPQYRLWLVRWVHWAAAHGLRVFWIISPDTSGAKFLADTQAEVAFLSAADALPHHWIVENYYSYTTVDKAEVTAPGSGYTHATAKVTSPAVPWGTQAVVTARIEAGKVVSLEIVHPGAGYLSATVVIDGDGTGATGRLHVVPREGARPASTVIPGDPRMPNPNLVGREDLPGSIAQVALWVAGNAPVRPLPPGAPILSGLEAGRCQP